MNRQCLKDSLGYHFIIMDFMLTRCGNPRYRAYLMETGDIVYLHDLDTLTITEYGKDDYIEV